MIHGRQGRATCIYKSNKLSDVQSDYLRCHPPETSSRTYMSSFFVVIDDYALMNQLIGTLVISLLVRRDNLIFSYYTSMCLCALKIIIIRYHIELDP